jgi:hypothetical protein
MNTLEVWIVVGVLGGCGSRLSILLRCGSPVFDSSALIAAFFSVLVLWRAFSPGSTVGGI